MTTIKLHNTKTRRKEAFTPLDPDNVRMYVCGPTVYDRAHLGNARPVVVFDVLNRLLRHVYGDDHVTYVRNFTDVDDKINARAAADNRKIGDITEETIQWFLDDMGALGALEPDAMPRATQFIPQMVAMIEDLIAKGHAYEAEGHVLFAVESYTEYGALSGRTVDDMIAGARVEVAPYKRNPMDFVLWKPSSDDLPGWDSPWGRGRPGWHIECSAMAYELLGESFDIHGGGNDLMFPHHENEIAQSCCAHPEGGFAQVWMHNEMLQVEGKKMSKSLGNFFTVRDLLDQGVPGEVIRFVFLSTHYRKPMDWTAEKAKEAEKVLRKIAQFLGRPMLQKPWVDRVPKSPPQEIIEALSSDLNTSLALTLMGKYLKSEQETDLIASLSFLGFDPNRIVERFQTFSLRAHTNEYVAGVGVETRGTTPEAPPQALLRLGERFQKVRAEAMRTKDYSEVDHFKAELVDAGVEVRMNEQGVEMVPGPNFDPAKLEALK
ncbi:cysteine--tRNA ligase [Pseudohalocynthiibacter aestuariivivens]|nr:cysteine--tRNA ligase [Pseudohalocynthiibacter aestuariivivens]QIE45945.1 cysteine--tRNA ligase [Pseudohalocynthiibacter aestuariivivens]